MLAAIALLALVAVGAPLPAAEPVATSAAHVQVPAGFRAELVRSAAPGEDSWISMAFDPTGGVIVGLDQRGVGRLAPAADGTWAFTRLDDTLRHCRGVLHAHGALYVCATDSKELWRLVDADGDGRYEQRQLLRSFDYRSRYGHGPNQLTAGPDGMIYLMCGDDVSFPPGTSPASPYRNPRKDRVLPDPRDDAGDDRVGFLLRTDPLGTEWTVVTGGLRNPVDVAFSPDGEAFTWDADMEWDVGLPWYRPTRLLHLVPGGEYGWRIGSGPWPAHEPDALPGALDTGLSSPTGLAFGHGSRFPAPWRERLFMADWQHGRILAVTLRPVGASYSATDTLFAAGAPLNVCDMAFGPDGALWVITGGRGSTSGLYRISWVGDESGGADADGAARSDPAAAGAGAAADPAAARARRRALERHQLAATAEAVADLWPDLGSADRFLRHAARVGLERQPLEGWRDRVAAEPDPLRRATTLVAWVRSADDAGRQEALAACLDRAIAGDGEASLSVLRAVEIALARGPAPAGELRGRLVAQLRDLAAEPLSVIDLARLDLLVALGAGDVAATLHSRLRAAPAQEDQIRLVRALLRQPAPPTADEETTLVGWFAAARRFTGGHLLAKVIGQMEEDWLATLPEARRPDTAARIAALVPPLPAEAPGAVRPVVRRYSVDDVAAALPAGAVRDRAAGLRALAAASCLKCHRFGATGAALGPDLSAVGGRFDRRTLAEAIVDPARVVDPKYQVTTWVLADGRVITGRAAQVNAAEITVETDALSGAMTKIVRAEIESSHPAAGSPMPAGLLDTLSADEVADLVGLLVAGAAPGAAGPPR
ncbi:MAG: PQQ-dependent sugar dehydrogenase [Planctomycetes bacterium]|nr:PQQ-dependent sugar dehydrogenase [Planctomycetota bacterium]